MPEATETKPPTKRQQRRETRKTEMLDAAMAIVVADGIDGLTIARLAGDLDAAVGALYRYFPGKEALVMALQIRAIEAFGDTMRREVDKARRAVSSETWERPEVLALVPLLASLRAYPRFHAAEPELHHLIDSSISAPQPMFDADDFAAIEAVLAPVLAIPIALIDEATDKGALDSGDSTQRAHVAWGSLHGLGHFRKRDRFAPDGLDSDALVEAAIRTLVRGWGASRADLDAAFRRK